MKLFKNQWFDLTDEDRNNLVFNGRNKDYGAYLLRKNYNQTLVRSMAIAGFTIIGLFLIPQFTKIEAKEVVVDEFEEPDLEYIYTPPPPKEEETFSEKETKKSEPIENQTGKKSVVGDIADKVDTTLDDKDKYRFVDIPSIGKIGNQDPDFFPQFPVNGSSIGSNIIQPSGNGQEEATLSPTEMPEFYGGEKALFAYLSSHLQFPEIAKREGVSGKVHIAFIIEKDGSISNIKILKCNTLNYGFENESSRVIENMPKWKPGRQNGRPVRVRYNIPIHFKLS